jgi:hypothetical protein
VFGVSRSFFAHFFFFLFLLFPTSYDDGKLAPRIGSEIIDPSQRAAERDTTRHLLKGLLAGLGGNLEHGLEHFRKSFASAHVREDRIRALQFLVLTALELTSFEAGQMVVPLLHCRLRHDRSFGSDAGSHLRSCFAGDALPPTRRQRHNFVSAGCRNLSKRMFVRTYGWCSHCVRSHLAARRVPCAQSHSSPTLGTRTARLFALLGICLCRNALGCADSQNRCRLLPSQLPCKVTGRR